MMYHIEITLKGGERILYDSPMKIEELFKILKNADWLEVLENKSNIFINTKDISLVRYEKYDENAF